MNNNSNNNKTDVMKQMDEQGVNVIHHVTFQTKEGNTHSVIDLGVGKVAVETKFARSVKVDRYVTKGDIHSLMRYVKEKHGAKVIDWETLQRPVGLRA